MIKEQIQPELKDVIDMINRYVKANKNQVCFIGDFFAFDAEKLKNNAEDVMKEGADRICIFGNRDTLRIMLNELRDIVEDEADEDGFVNI